MKDIVEFIINAKRATYAGKGPETVSTRPQTHYAGRVIGKNFNGDYTYICKVDGDFDWFQGDEVICCHGEKIFLPEGFMKQMDLMLMGKDG